MHLQGQSLLWQGSKVQMHLPAWGIESKGKACRGAGQWAAHANRCSLALAVAAIVVPRQARTWASKALCRSVFPILAEQQALRPPCSWSSAVSRQEREREGCGPLQLKNEQHSPFSWNCLSPACSLLVEAPAGSRGARKMVKLALSSVLGASMHVRHLQLWTSSYDLSFTQARSAFSCSRFPTSTTTKFRSCRLFYVH